MSFEIIKVNFTDWAVRLLLISRQQYQRQFVLLFGN